MSVRMAAAVVAAALAASAAWGLAHPPPTVSTLSQPSMNTVAIGTATVQVEVAATASARGHGLSGRSGLAPQSGMLFIFDTAGAYGFWMKDMRFPLDLVWADASGEIVSIDANVAPSTYPKVFYPARPARYVLEVNAGFAKAHGIAEGQNIVIQ